MSTFKLVIFDFDGTLADSAPWFFKTIREMAPVHRFKAVDDAEIELLRGKTNREVIRHLGVRFWQMPGIARDLRARSAAAHGEIPLFVGVPELLQRAKEAGVTLAIVSSNGEVTVRGILGASAVLIDHYICGVSLFGKARKFTRLARSLGLAPHEVLAVGDEGRDVEAAKKAGFVSAAVTWGYATEDGLKNASPQYLVRTIDELSAIIGR